LADNHQQVVRDFVARLLRLYQDMRHQHGSVIGPDTPPSVAQPPTTSAAQRLAIGALETALDDAIAASFPASDPPS
jgi:hypothetical protein